MRWSPAPCPCDGQGALYSALELEPNCDGFIRENDYPVIIFPMECTDGTAIFEPWEIIDHTTDDFHWRFGLLPFEIHRFFNILDIVG